jgi:hypothetical protein
MRRILLSKRGEFSYQIKRSTSLGLAIKRLGEFFESIDGRDGAKSNVTVSNKISDVNRRKVQNN